MAVEHFLTGSRYAGIEVFSSGNEEKAHCLLVKKKNNELLVVSDGAAEDGAFPSDPDKNLPFYLIVNTSQIIHKEIPGTDASNEKSIHKAFPNISWEEFYYDLWRLKSNTIIAVGRKNYVDGLIGEYEKRGIAIAGFSLGVCAVAELQSLAESRQLSTSTQDLDFDGNPVIASSETRISPEKKYHINGLSVTNSQLLPFAGILRLVTRKSSAAGNIVAHNEILHQRFLQRSFFRKGVKAMIGTLLLVLLSNFFFFNAYFKKSQQTAESLLANKSALELVAKAKQRIIAKQERLKNIDGSASNSSAIINEIVKKVPSTILLSELAYNPLEKKVAIDEPIKTLDKTITISGVSNDNMAFTNWIEQLEKLQWIDTATITHFGKDEANQTVFSIKLALK